MKIWLEDGKKSVLKKKFNFFEKSVDFSVCKWYHNGVVRNDNKLNKK